LAVLAALIFTALLGPKPAAPNLDPTPLSISIPIDSLDGWLAHRESGYRTLKPGNEAHIEWWNDSVQVTEYAVVYLHGFSASHEEGAPVHRLFAQRYGCNLYLPRLYAHGLDTTEPLMDLTPENYLRSAKEAIAVGKQIGRHVIVMNCSTGGTLAIYLAAHDPEVDALISYSPNIDIFDPNSKVLTMPWGMQLARIVSGGPARQYDASDEFKRYWQTRYRLEGLATVRQLIDGCMTPETFARVKQPIFVGAYYKDAVHQDSVVSVAAMRAMMPLLGTPQAQQQLVEFAHAGAHVMTNPLRGRDVETVTARTFTFAEQKLGLVPVPPQQP